MSDPTKKEGNTPDPAKINPDQQPLTDSDLEDVTGGNPVNFINNIAPIFIKSTHPMLSKSLRQKSSDIALSKSRSFAQIRQSLADDMIFDGRDRAPNPQSQPSMPH